MDFPEDGDPVTLDEVRQRLGEPEVSFTPDWSSLVFIFVVAAGSIGIGVMLLVAVFIDGFLNSMFIGFGVSIAFLGMLVIWAIDRATNFRVLIYPEVLVVRFRRQVCIMPWNTIEEIIRLEDAADTIEIIRSRKSRLSFPTDFVWNAMALRTLLVSEARRRGIKCNGVSPSVYPRQSNSVNEFNLPTIQPSVYPRQSNSVNEFNLPTIQSSVNLSAFGESAAQLLQLAEQIAREFLHDYLATEHVLLALLEGGPNNATLSMQRCGVDPSVLQQRLKAIIPGGSTNPDKLKTLPQTLRLVDAFLMAEDELAVLGTHLAILMGLVREQQGIAGVILAAVGVTEAGLRKAAGVRATVTPG